MMIKLLKYDLKKVLGFLVYFYVISFGFAVITRLINIGKDIQFINQVIHRLKRQNALKSLEWG